MPPKKKKDKKPVEVKDPMTAVDRTFYELTITDLNQKLSHLRSHNATIEERNEQIEETMRQFQEDRTDVTAFLDRTLKVKVNTILDLEEKLTELAEVRAAETIEFQRQIKEGELRYKTMQDELTSEIKLLTGKLNSIEEFRIQKDELLAKFDQQETELRIQTKQHRDLIYDIERKQVMDKDRMKKEVENKLLQLSNEFAKSNEIRISAHVQRLVRENIALNNELDRMMFSQRRLQQENKTILERDANRQNATAVVRTENSDLILRNDIQLELIKQLTLKYEQIQFQKGDLLAVQKAQITKQKICKDAEKEMKESRHKLRLLEQYVHSVHVECQNHSMQVKQQAAELQRLQDILIKLKLTVKSAARGEKDSKDDPKFRAAQRKHLLDELVEILVTVETIPPNTVSSFETVGSAQELYRLGDLGISPPYSLTSLLCMGRPINRLQRSRQSALAAAAEASKNAAAQIESEGSSYISVRTYESWPIIDLETASSALVLSESSKNEADGLGGGDENLEDDQEDFGASSSDDASPAAAKQAADPTNPIPTP